MTEHDECKRAHIKSLVCYEHEHPIHTFYNTFQCIQQSALHQPIQMNSIAILLIVVVASLASGQNSELSCGANAFAVNCMLCQRTCESDEQPRCLKMCVAGCDCEEGYYHNIEMQCIHHSKCV